MNQQRWIHTAATISIVSTSLVGACTDGDRGAHWGSAGDIGPSHWGDLSPEYALAKSGREQSPIDISNARATALNQIEFSYRPSPLDIVNNGHTIQVNYQKGSYLMVDGVRYDLLQFHFHSPSENTINGSQADLELHLVHADENGELAVVAVMLEEAAHNAALEVVWTNMPEHEGQQATPNDILVNAEHLLPDDEGYFRFAGSLTTPPCSEGVCWFVMDTPLSLSNEQIEAFRRIYYGNNRPVQPTYDRVILHSR